MTGKAARRTAAGETARRIAPQTITIAVRLMYAGAAATAIGMVISVIGVALGLATLRASHPTATPAQLHATQTVLVVIAILSGLAETAIWLVMARANRSGLKWARTVASVLFLLSSWNLVDHLLGAITVSNLTYTAVIWLIGLGAICFLWQAESRTYFG
jgi:uncharacterized membrane protein